MIAVYGLRATELILIIALLLPAVINGWVLWMVFKGRKRNRKVRKYPVLPEQSSQLAKLYRKAGAKAELVFIEQAHHAFWNYKPWFKMKRWNAPPRFFLHVHISTYREWRFRTIVQGFHEASNFHNIWFRAVKADFDDRERPQ